jgi:uncharacterized protein YlxW (UPF0749 family)
MGYEFKTLAELIAERARQVRHAQALARLDADRELRDEVRHLHERENQKDFEIHDLQVELQSIKQWQKENSPILQGARVILNAGIVMKWIIALALGSLALIGGIFGVLEGLKKWFP